jgi:class 3 adenylate cyclase
MLFGSRNMTEVTDMAKAKGETDKEQVEQQEKKPRKNTRSLRQIVEEQIAERDRLMSSVLPPSSTNLANILFGPSASDVVGNIKGAASVIESPEVLELRNAINILQQDISKRTRRLREAEATTDGIKSQLEELQGTYIQLQEKERLSYLLPKVNSAAGTRLLASENFREYFADGKRYDACVMSVDIRRSTELMLKAREPQLFAHFITELSEQMTSVVKDHYGVFDKFTGDGILAFFPDFFTGDDASYHAVTAADNCHELFKDLYSRYRSSFTSVLLDTGLGIGIDFGEVQLAEIAGGITVVGSPVVYACRMAAAPAGITLLNQPAYEKVCERMSGHCFIDETEIDVKHEGRTLAYQVRRNSSEYKPELPPWLTESAANQEGDTETEEE